LVAVTLITVQTEVIRRANRPAVLRTIIGNIGAIRTIADDGFFSPQRPGLKEDARSSTLAEKDLTFYVKRFLVTAPGPILTRTNSPATITR
jgi:hypothetical protein